MEHLPPPAPGQITGQLPPPLPQQKAEGFPAPVLGQMPEQLPPPLLQQRAETFNAPKPEDLLIKGSMDKNGHVSFRENDGKFMSKAKVAEIGANAHTNSTALAEHTADKPWNEMTDEEQLAKAHADGYKDAYADKERDTLVLGKKHETAEETAEAENNEPFDVDPADVKWAEGPKAIEAAKPLAAPKAEGLIISSYVDSESKPVMEMPSLLKATDQSVEEGDKAKFEAASQAMLTSAAHEAGFRGDEAYVARVRDYVNILEHKFDQGETETAEPEVLLSDEEYINSILAALEARADAQANAIETTAAEVAGETASEADDEAEAATVRRGLKQRLIDAKNAVYVSVGTFFGRAREQEATPENRRSKKGLWIGLGAVAAAGTALLALRYGLNNSSTVRSGEASDILNQPPAPGSSGSVNIAPVAEQLPGNAPSGSGSVQLAEQAANASAETPVATFTAVNHRWQEGDPTIWSFVRGQGVPENQVDDLLNEWNPNWAQVGQNMQPGESVDIPVELINKYKQPVLPAAA